MNIAGGDWRFFYPENITNFIGIPQSWDSSLNTGIGMSALNTLWITGYLYFSSLLTKLGFSWNMVGLLCWILPSIVIGFVSMYLLFRLIWDDSKKFALIASLIYVGNTYFLMILSGGQLGVSLAYGLVPLVVVRFLKNLRLPNLYNSLFFGFVFALQILFDPRITIVTLVLLLAFVFIQDVKLNLSFWKYVIFIPIIFVSFVHGYWVFPILIFYTGSSIVPTIYSASNDFSFFSFAKLENSISLLHPNWPENIFGRVHFMRPEFIVIPILAFSSLLNRKIKRIRTIVIVILVSLICIFLAKGASDPFGIIYIMLLKHVPGFSVFRDPTKFYIPIAICYSLLIPLGLEYISTHVSKFKRFKKKGMIITTGAFVILWIVLLSPLFQGKVNGIFRLRTVSSDYVNLKNFLVQQPNFFRTLWIPQIQRFGYFSNNHPAIGRGEIFQKPTLKGMVEELKSKDMEQKLMNLSVRYVVVPYDSEAEIFVNDGKYDKKQYDSTVQQLERIPYLSKDRVFGSLVLFKTKKYNDHFKFTKELTSGSVRILSSSPSKYRLSILPSSSTLLVFGDSFDRNWVMKTPTETIYSKDYSGLNSFKLSNIGYADVEISYVPQNAVNMLCIISLVLMLSSGAYLISFAKRKK